MYRRTIHRGIAALVLVLLVALVGAQPAAAADRSSTGRFTGFWAAVLDVIPGAQAALDVLTGWFPVAESSADTPPTKTEQGWGIDPNGNSLTGQPIQNPLGSGGT